VSRSGGQSWLSWSLQVVKITLKSPRNILIFYRESAPLRTHSRYGP
jgi:hypothetical protein